MYFVYVLYNKTSNKFYVGFTQNIQRRLSEHKHGYTYTTKKFNNLKLVYYEACISNKDAVRRERQLKTGFGRGYLKRRLENYLQGL